MLRPRPAIAMYASESIVAVEICSRMMKPLEID
jgi:hypothetical protein